MLPPSTYTSPSNSWQEEIHGPRRLPRGGKLPEGRRVSGRIRCSHTGAFSGMTRRPSAPFKDEPRACRVTHPEHRASRRTEVPKGVSDYAALPAASAFNGLNARFGSAALNRMLSQKAPYLSTHASHEAPALPATQRA